MDYDISSLAMSELVDFLTLESLYDLSTDSSCSNRYECIKTLLEDGKYQLTGDIGKLMEYHLTDDCDIRVIQLLIDYDIIGETRFRNYDDYDPGDYGYKSPSQLLIYFFIKNLCAKNMIQLRFQIDFSVDLKTTDIYLDPDRECYLSILNYVYTNIPDNEDLINLLMKHGFQDHRTHNSNHRRIKRPLTCIESACERGLITDVQKFIDYDADQADNIEYALIYMSKLKSYSDEQISCFKLLLTNVTNKDQLIHYWKTKYSIQTDHKLYNLMHNYIKEFL
jgi:hypothetical protein